LQRQPIQCYYHSLDSEVRPTFAQLRSCLIPLGYAGAAETSYVSWQTDVRERASYRVISGRPRIQICEPDVSKKETKKMRSELVFRAKETVENKYRLCQTASKATRRLHISARNTTDTINNAFDRIADGDDDSMSDDFLPMRLPIVA
jgi:hypothetical protein